MFRVLISFRMEKENIIRVYLSNGSYNNVRYNHKTTVARIIEVMVAQLAGADGDSAHFAMRLVREPRQLPADTYWLHRLMNMKQVLEVFEDQSQWRYELRVRFLCNDLREFFHTQKRCFEFFYDQVRNDYLTHVAAKIDENTALELGCLEIRRLFKDMQSSALDKKANMEFIEQEIGLDRFFPSTLIQAHASKVLRRKIQTCFKRFSPLVEADCMFRFLEILAKIARYDIEIFKASLGDSWNNPVEVVVGPEIGLCYVSGSKNGPVKLADFLHVTLVSTPSLQPVSGTANQRSSSARVSLCLRVSGQPDPVHITCPNQAIADSLAHLIEGYQMLMTQAVHSVWVRDDNNSTRTGDGTLAEAHNPGTGTGTGTNRQKWDTEMKTQAHMDRDRKVPNGNVPHTIEHNIQDTTQLIDSEELDYATPLARDYQVERCNVMLEQLLGEGQFGDVYKGTMMDRNRATVNVAVKACKVENEDAVADSFLEEAYLMQQFSHAHIIKLLGVCLQSPIWLIIELALLGELRTYLITHKHTLSMSLLTLYCHQLSMALSYLESRHFVHRDIAARNVLVASETCVKLSDFGLCRSVEKESFYTASKGKLPIKWMAPESINFRRFSLSSDVWMFAVCIWEIVAKGVKPFQGVRNHDVIHRLEAGERLAAPQDCAPRLYALLCHMWSYEPNQRPNMRYVRDYLQQLVLEDPHAQTQTNGNGQAQAQTQTNGNGQAQAQTQTNGNGQAQAQTQNAKHVAWTVNDAYVRPANETSAGNQSTALLPTSTAMLVKQQQKVAEQNEHEHSHFDQPHKQEDTHQCSCSSDSSTNTGTGGRSNPNYSATVPVTDRHEKLRDELLNTLDRQREQSERDTRWLDECKVAETAETMHSLLHVTAPHIQYADADTDTNAQTAVSSASISWPEYELPHEMELDREHDQVYLQVLAVVKQVTLLSRVLPDAVPDDYFAHVKGVGEALRHLLTQSSALLDHLPATAASDVHMAEKVLGADMHKLVAAMRLAMQYANTTLDTEYKRSLLSDAHVLALDCKNFLEAIDSARIRCGQATLKPKRTSEPNHKTGSPKPQPQTTTAVL